VATRRRRPGGAILLGAGVRVPPELTVPGGRVERLAFTAPIPPSTNHLYATVNGLRTKTQAARDYAKGIGSRAVAARALAGGVPQPPYMLELRVWFPDESKRDLSNLIKCLEDALMKAIRSDDRHVHRLVIERQGVDAANPRVDVVLSEWRGDASAVAPAARETI
jgi:crossover junction endodeoxyribonuclease RusA